MTKVPSIFVRFMNEVFTKNTGKNTPVYLDDIIFYSPNKEKDGNDLLAVLGII